MSQTNYQLSHYSLVVLLLLSLIGYNLPWVTSHSASLTFGAFDLAEWASLHPVSRATPPLLFTSFLLRMPLICLTWIVAFNAPPYPLRSTWWWIYAGICLSLTIFSTPPLEFLTIFREDVNYIQQANLTVVAGIGSIIGLSGVLKQYRVYIVMMACIGGVIASIWGGINGYMLLTDFQIRASLGIGLILTVVMFVNIGVYVWWIISKRRHRYRLLDSKV